MRDSYCRPKAQLQFVYRPNPIKEFNISNCDVLRQIKKAPDPHKNNFCYKLTVRLWRGVKIPKQIT